MSAASTKDRLCQISNSIFLVSNIVSPKQKKNVNVFLFLLSPEDTTEIDGGRHPQTVKYNAGNTLGVLKALFWIAISLVFSLMVGQLH